MEVRSTKLDPRKKSGHPVSTASIDPLRKRLRGEYELQQRKTFRCR